MTLASRITKLESLVGDRRGGDEARLAGDAGRAEIHRMLSSPDELAREMALDVQLLGSDSPGRIDFRGMDSEEIAMALESALSASTP